jgi:hypothetical protein
MTDAIEKLRKQMEAAAEALDFEEARRLRDQLSLLQIRPDAVISADLDTSRLKRQVPGQMGLGTSDPAFLPPEGWIPPKKPDFLTIGRRRAKRRR